MIEMNPYYAHESRVGPVFDVATYSVPWALGMAVTGFCLAVLMGVAAVYVWEPDLLIEKPPKWYADAHQDVKDLWKQYPRGTPVGIGVAGVLTLLFLATAGVFLRDAKTGNFFLRVGQGGLAARLPAGWGAQELEAAWDDILQLTVVQKKELGSLSRNAGNLGALLRLQMRDGTKHELDLDHFSQSGIIIYDRIQEARAMRPAQLG